MYRRRGRGSSEHALRLVISGDDLNIAIFCRDDHILRSINVHPQSFAPYSLATTEPLWHVHIRHLAQYSMQSTNSEVLDS